MSRLKFEGVPGDTIQKTVRRLLYVANATNEEIELEFSEVELLIKPGDDEQDIVNCYFEMYGKKR